MATQELTIPQAVDYGLECLRGGDLASAEKVFRAVLQSDPNHQEALHGLGLVASGTARYREAIAFMTKALSIDARRADICSNLGAAYAGVGEHEEAIRLFRESLRVDPALFPAHNNISSSLGELRRYPEAAEEARRAIAINPRHSGAHQNLGNMLAAQGLYVQAAASLRRALELAPETPWYQANLGTCLLQSGRAEEAIDFLRPLSDQWLEITGVRGAYLMALSYSSSTDAAQIVREHARLGAVPAPEAKLARRARRDGQRTRVGYLSPDLRDHSVASFIEPVLEHHDRSRFEVFCYYSNSHADATTARLRSRAEHWVEVGKLSDAAVAERIAADGIDVLVDLAGHTVGSRLGALALRPARAQLSYLGYPTSSGLPAMTARVSDAYVDPEGYERFNVEPVLRLPGSYFCYRPPQECPEIAMPSESDGPITFGSFNNLAKVSAECIELWAKVLAAVPGSRLLLKAKALADDETRQELAAKFARAGVDAGCLVLQGQSADAREHLSRYNEVNVALDTTPYNGATTTCEALWMGVPVVSLVGERHVARMGLSILTAAGRAGWCADTPGRFVEIAAGLAGDRGARDAFRREARESLGASALLDGERFTRDFESLLRKSV